LSLHGALLLFGGLALLVVAAEMVIRGASRLAASLGVEPLVLGLTVVAVGTSAPELAVGITAAMQGAGDLAVGNIAGTNLFNILFILGLTAMVRPLPLHLQVLRLDLPMMVFAAALMTLFAWDGVITRLDGAIMVGIAVLYTVALVRLSRRETAEVKEEFEAMYGDGVPHSRQAIVRERAVYALVLIVGLALSVLGANWLVDGAVAIARGLNISEAIIGLTIVAVGTSAPELVTTIVATIRDEREVAVGNLLGSSIYNILVILGITCLATPGGVPVERELMLVDIPLMAGVALLCIPVFVTGRQISRVEGGIGVAIYVAYMVWLVAFRA
jgi:cation:H+ antiporter